MKTSSSLLALLLFTPVAAQPQRGLETNLPQLDAAISTVMKDSGVPGLAVGIVHDGKVVFLKGYGVRQAGRPEAVDADTVFQLASCSKPMTSTAVASLAGKHILSYDDPVVKYLPEFRLADEWVSQHATIRDMLSHRSGLPDFAGDLLEQLGFNRAAIVQRLRFLPAKYPFRSGYAYTNYGYTVGGVAAAQAAGYSYEEMMDRELFRPLGMTSASARFSDYVRRPNRAHTHVLEKSGPRATVHNADPQAPAAAVSCSARDMLRWAQFHLDTGQYGGKQRIDSEALQQTYQIHAVTRDNPGDFSSKGYYGMGWNVAYDNKGRYKLGHSGAFDVGARSVVTLLPQEKLGVVVLGNGFPSGLPEGVSAGVVHLYDTGEVDAQLMSKVDKQVAAAIGGLLAQHPPQVAKSPAPAQPLGNYTGDFHHDYLGDVAVALRSGKLVLEINERELALGHVTRDTFRAKAGPQMDVDPFELSFVFDAAGKVAGFRTTGLGEIGSPYFEKI